MAHCPFCLESVNDEATVCKTCRRDFAPLRPLQKQVEDLQTELARARLEVEELKAKVPATTDRPSPLAIPPSADRATFGVLAIPYLVLLVARQNFEPKTVDLMAMGFTAATGAWLAVRLPQPQTKAWRFAVAGGILGLFRESLTPFIVFVGAYRVDAHSAKSILGTYLIEKWAAMLWAVILYSALGFTFGVAVRWLRNRRAGRGSGTLAHAIASGIGRRKGGAFNVEASAKLIGAIGAVLLPLATITVAVLTFLSKSPAAGAK
jgi:hypothetical protein